MTANERSRKWRAANRDLVNSRSRGYKKAARLSGKKYGRQIELDLLLIQLKAKPCADCGNEFPTCCMDFDHRPGTEKVNNVGTMFAHHWSQERILAEIAKCDLVCANCHRIRTQARRKIP
jgi:hypothetical protein